MLHIKSNIYLPYDIRNEIFSYFNNIEYKEEFISELEGYSSDLWIYRYIKKFKDKIIFERERYFEDGHLYDSSYKNYYKCQKDYDIFTLFNKDKSLTFIYSYDDTFPYIYLTVKFQNSQTIYDYINLKLYDFDYNMKYLGTKRLFDMDTYSSYDYITIDELIHKLYN